MIFAFYKTTGLWWFRVLGYGVRWKDTRTHRLLFSERTLGHGRLWGHWHFAWLRPGDCFLWPVSRWPLFSFHVHKPTYAEDKIARSEVGPSPGGTRVPPGEGAV